MTERGGPDGPVAKWIDWTFKIVPAAVALFTSLVLMIAWLAVIPGEISDLKTSLTDIAARLAPLPEIRVGLIDLSHRMDSYDAQRAQLEARIAGLERAAAELRVMTDRARADLDRVLQAQDHRR